MSSVPVKTDNKYHGQVKWFNNKAGYGFIKFVGENSTDKDIFVHHSSILVNANSYKTLFDGEYIEFSISNIKNPTQDGHKVQAVEVRGLYGGKLMCEFRSRKRE
jgi:cold shock CspA family protein